MNRGFPRIGAKPSPASPGNYVRDFTRRIKDRGRRHDRGTIESRSKLLPSTEPIPVELTKTDTSITGWESLGIIFLICLTLFAAIAWFG